MSTLIFNAIFIAYYVLVLGVAIGVVLDNKNPSKTLAYLLVLLFVPIVGLVVYFLFGQNLRKQKLFSRKGIYDNERIKKWKQDRIEGLHNTSDLRGEKMHNKLKVADLLLKNNDAVITKNNDVHVLHDSSEIFASMWEDMRKAKHHLHVEFYIVEDDIIGNEFKDILIDRAKNGVEVRFSVDDVGGRKLSKKYIRELQDVGVEVCTFMPVFFPYLTGKANYRNHRKIVVVDGKVGYIGGINIADRYTNRLPNKPFWRDTQLRIYGEAVKNLQLEFLLNWNFVSGKSVAVNDLFFPQVSATENHMIQIASAGPDSDWPNIMQAIILAANLAEEYIYITTPYFIPNDEVIVALQTAALSGVDVQILLPKNGDSLLTQAASMSYVRQMLDAGVKVHRYNKGFVHAKIMVVDHSFCTIGTTNMDNRSFNINFEINAFCYDKVLAENIYQQFLIDRETSEEITLNRWDKRPRTKRVIESIARMFAPLL